MKRYVLDANAVIINFENRNGSEKVQKLLETAGDGEIEIFMSVINLAEVFSSLWKRHGEPYARQAIQIIMASPIKIIEVNTASALEVAEIRATFHSGMGDCFAAWAAMAKRATLVTADSGFRKYGDKFKVLWLPNQKAVN